MVDWSKIIIKIIVKVLCGLLIWLIMNSLGIPSQSIRTLGSIIIGLFLSDLVLRNVLGIKD